jgi:hypothetical protein
MRVRSRALPPKRSGGCAVSRETVRADREGRMRCGFMSFRGRPASLPSLGRLLVHPVNSLRFVKDSKVMHADIFQARDSAEAGKGNGRSRAGRSTRYLWRVLGELSLRTADDRSAAPRPSWDQNQGRREFDGFARSSSICIAERGSRSAVCFT